MAAHEKYQQHLQEIFPSSHTQNNTLRFGRKLLPSSGKTWRTKQLLSKLSVLFWTYLRRRKRFL